MILYINGNKIQLEESNPIPLTKQVNTIGSLSSRQNDFVQNLKAPLTSNNNKALGFLSIAGSNSQTPYNRNTAKLYSDTGDSIINNGFAIIKKTDKYYNITIYEGIISFWKKIENVTLKDVGLPNLNHLRNVSNIINSLENKLDYRYLIADYNGKFLSDAGNLNADYLIPSALVSYVFQRVFEYAGYTYTGDVFESDDFLNEYISYPKSIGSTNQNTTLLHSENFQTQTVNAFFPSPSGNGYITFYYNYLFQDLIDSNIYVESAGNYNEIINIKTSGLYQFKLNGFIDFPDLDSSFGLFYWINSPSEVTELINNIDSNTQIDLTVNLTLNAGDQISFGFSSSVFVFEGINLGTSNLDTSISLVVGDSVDFEEAFIDLKCTDFIKEVMWKFSLTPFASRFDNNINFLTEDERYQESNVLDWTDKFVDKIDTKYQIGYAQKNNFKYKYNDENENHNDGYILVNDVNLPEEKTVIQSVTYSPERFTTFLGSNELLIVKMWNKDIKDDGSIEYKDLQKRFHFLRQENINGSITIESDLFAEQGSTILAKKAVFESLSYKNIISKRYNSTRTILNSTKLETVLLKINSNEATGLDLTKRYHFKQLGGDYIINKMIKYVPNNPTKFELLKINSKAIQEQPPLNVPLFIDIISTDVANCTLTLGINTNIDQPASIQIRAVSSFIDVSTGLPLRDLYFDASIDNNQVVFDLNNLEDSVPLKNWYFSLRYIIPFSNTIVSNQTEIINIGSCGTEPPPPPTQSITITSLQTLSVINNVRTVRVNFVTDFITPTDFDYTAFSTYAGIDVVVGNVIATNYIDLQLQDNLLSPLALTIVWGIYLEKDGNVISNQLFSNG